MLKKINWEKINWKKVSLDLWQLLLFLLTPAVMFLQVELLEENQLYNIREPFFLLNYIWYAIVAGALLLLIRRLRYALMTSVGMAYLIGLANHYVVEFRGTPILPWDFKSFGTALEVAGNYDYGFTSYTWAITIATACYFVLLHFLASKEKVEVKSKTYLSIAGIYFILTGSVWYVHSTTGLLGFYNWTVFAWNQKVQYQCCGVAASFMENLRFMEVEKPEGYNREELETLAIEYKEEKLENAEAKKPNIIVIMNESFADISVVKDLGDAAEYMPFFDSLTENAVRGQLNVSAFGGNTCNTEFEFLTSLSMAFVPIGSVPYQQYIDRDMASICTILKEQGYSTTAIHPCSASNWNRDKVYPYLGFDEFISENDFSPENTEYLRGYMSDKADFNQLIEEYEARKAGGPFFLFNVTMQNHGGYSGGTDMYIDLVRKTDRELARLVEYLKEQPEPTLLLFFGDHQPNLQDGTYDAINKETNRAIYRNKYLVPFMLWANYEIEKKEMEETSPSFLAPLLLDTADLSMPPYYRLLLEKMGKVPALSINGYKEASGAWLPSAEESKEETITLYKRMQYNKLFDKKNYVGELFE